MKTIKLFSFVPASFLLIACHEPTVKQKWTVADEESNMAYQNLLKREDQKNEKVDSIFFGLYFKMTTKSFYEYCNKMFKKGIFNGSYDYQVVVELKNPFSRPIILKFYPTFEKPFISKMLCLFRYKEMNVYKNTDRADFLMKELLPVMMKWYRGNEFIEIPSAIPLKGPKYIKVDANRKITLSESGDGTGVEAIFEDLKPLK